MRRLLANPRVSSARILEPFARQVFEEASAGGQTILLSLDQTDWGERFAVLMMSVRCGDRSLPLGWQIETGEANIGFIGQQGLLERVRNWLPEGASVLLLADRFSPSVALFEWLLASGCSYRLRRKGNLAVDVGRAGIHTTGDWVAGSRERYEPKARLFAAGIPTAIGVRHEPGPPEPWIIAMDCPPNRAAFKDYGARWAIEPMFSDFKSRGFRLEDTHLESPQAPRRPDPDHGPRDVLVCPGRAGRRPAQPHRHRKKAREQTHPHHWSVRKAYRRALSWFKRGLRLLLRCVASARPLPKFFVGNKT